MKCINCKPNCKGKKEILPCKDFAEQGVVLDKNGKYLYSVKTSKIIDTYSHCISKYHGCLSKFCICGCEEPQPKVNVTLEEYVKGRG